ncbi:hypothetical protein tb265_49160 [Gemmatimonadetes bacterium T265]|nr:hypothetical protein tb265_49160 [Gemmatimonadetes bacterium T265]
MPAPSTPRTAPDNPDRRHLARVARRLADPELGTGALASIRRGDPATVSRQPTYHRLLRELDDAALAADGALRWAAAVHVLAMLARPGVAPPARPAGEALAAAGYPESRLARLLASRDDAFRDQAVLAARFLHSRDEACSPLDLAELALVEGLRERRADQLRHRLARGYYQVFDAAPATPAKD